MFLTHAHTSREHNEALQRSVANQAYPSWRRYVGITQAGAPWPKNTVTCQIEKETDFLPTFHLLPVLYAYCVYCVMYST